MGTPCSLAHHTLLSMGFLRQEYWRGLPFPSPGNLPNPGIEPRSLTLWADSLPSDPPEKLIKVKWALRVEHSSNRFSVFRKGNTREFSLCLCVFSSISFPNPPPCVRTQGEASLGRKNSYQNLTLLAPWSETFSPQNCEEINFYWLFHWVYCILCWYSWLTNTNSCILEIYQNNEEEIETVIALLRNLCDFAKRILSLISTSYGLTASLT